MNRRTFLTGLGAVAATRQLPQWQNAAFESVEENFITIERFPYVQNVGHDTATIMWATQEAGFATVQYSLDGVKFQTAFAKSRLFGRTETGLTHDFYQYQTELTGLTADTTYVYQVFVNGVEITGGGELRFRTAGPGPFNFVVLGDTGYGSDQQFQIAQKILSERPSLVLHTGDIVYTQGVSAQGAYDLYQRRYFNYYSASMSSVPFFPCPGNHDYEFQNLAPYLAIHSLPANHVPVADRGRYYSFDWGNVHFVSVDSYSSLNRSVNAAGPMLRWLDNDLQSTRQFWRVVYFHHPPYAGGPNENDTESRWGRQFVQPILEAHGVQVVLSGHEHSYQRSKPIWKGSMVTSDVGINYVTSGGGGALLYPVNRTSSIAFGETAFHYLRVEVKGPQMIFHAIRFDGMEFDRFTVSPRPMFSDPLPSPPPAPNTSPVRFQPAPTQGSFIRISGRSLAEEALVCTSTPPFELGGTTVSINGQNIQLLYVSPTQIYGRLPFTIEGNINVRVTTRNGSSPDLSVNPG